MSAITHHLGTRGNARRRLDLDEHAQTDANGEVRPLERALLTPEEAARVLGIGRSKVYELILAGTLESLKIGACRRVPADAIDAFIAALRTGQQ